MHWLSFDSWLLFRFAVASTCVLCRRAPMAAAGLVQPRKATAIGSRSVRIQPRSLAAAASFKPLKAAGVTPPIKRRRSDEALPSTTPSSRTQSRLMVFPSSSSTAAPNAFGALAPISAFFRNLSWTRLWPAWRVPHSTIAPSGPSGRLLRFPGHSAAPSLTQQWEYPCPQRPSNIPVLGMLSWVGQR